MGHAFHSCHPSTNGPGGVYPSPVQVKAAGRSIAPTAAPQRPSRCGEAWRLGVPNRDKNRSHLSETIVFPIKYRVFLKPIH